VPGRAEEALGQVIHDELDWVDVLGVEGVEVASGSFQLWKALHGFIPDPLHALAVDILY
jgi:hypothetical protein